jgi:hypothetical protein
MLRSLKWSLPLRNSNENVVCISNLSHVCYMPCTSHPSLFNHHNNISWEVQIEKHLTMQFSPTYCYFLSQALIFFLVLYSHTPSICVLSLEWETKFHTQNNRHNYRFIYFNPYMSRQKARWQKTELNGSKHSPNLIWSFLFMNVTCLLLSFTTSELCHTSKDLLAIFIILSCILMMAHENVLRFLCVHF